MERRICRTCGGTGRITRHRSRWIGGGRNGYRSQYTAVLPCKDCEGVAMAFEIEGKQVDAPGFTAEKFAEFVDRAKANQLRTHPGNNAVMVMSTSSDARYATTRQSCTCQGHRGHGRCLHRAYAIYLVDVAGVDVMAIPTIGVSKRGVPLTYGRKPAAEVA